MTWDKNMGTLVRVERCEHEGKIGVRCVVEFYDGHGPDLTLNTVWQARPVKIVECDPAEISHYYSPSVMHQGDCAVCGHGPDAALHIKSGSQDHIVF